MRKEPYKKIFKSEGVTIFYIFAALFVIYVFFMALFTPHVGDDLKYALDYNLFLRGEADFPGFDAWMDRIRVHYLSVNGRFGDKLLVGYLLLPQALQAFLAAAGALGIIIGACKLAFGRISRYPYLCVAFLCCLVLLMPWYNTLFVGCMLLNYVIGGGIVFLFLWLLLRYYKHQSHSNWGQLILLTLLGFLAGAWHEGFTFIIIPGIAVYILMNRKFTRAQCFLLTGFILGAVFIICNPGFWYRLNHKMGGPHGYSFSSLFYISNVALVILVACPAVLAFKSLRNKYSVTDLSLIVISALAILANAYIFISNLSFPRVMWYGNILGFVGLGCVLKKVRLNLGFKNILKVFTFLTALFCIVHFIVSVVWQIKLSKEFKEVMNLYSVAEKGQVFYDSTTSVPWITLDRPSIHQFQTWRIDQWIPEFYRTDGEKLHLSPVRLKKFSPQKARLIGSNESVYLYQGSIVADMNSHPFSRGRKLTVQLKNGTTEKETAVAHQFKGADGKLYEYWALDNIESIKSISYSN